MTHIFTKGCRLHRHSRHSCTPNTQHTALRVLMQLHGFYNARMSSTDAAARLLQCPDEQLAQFHLAPSLQFCDVMWCDVMWCDAMWCDAHGVHWRRALALPALALAWIRAVKTCHRATQAAKRLFRVSMLNSRSPKRKCGISTLINTNPVQYSRRPCIGCFFSSTSVPRKAVSLFFRSSVNTALPLLTFTREMFIAISFTC